jgi:hypothetical protein
MVQSLQYGLGADDNSRRAVPIRRSHSEFALGARAGVRSARAPQVLGGAMDSGSDKLLADDSGVEYLRGGFSLEFKLPRDFVLNSLRHTMLTREAGVDAIAIMRIAGHSSITVSQPYVHRTPERLERAFERRDGLDRAKVQEPGTKSGRVNPQPVSMVASNPLN